MESSSRTERTATATTATTASTSTVAMTITTITSIRSTSSEPRRAERPAADARHDPCWCGQDMDVVRGDHCSRCGTMRMARVGAALPRLAA